MNLIDYLPSFYIESPEVVSVENAIGTQAQALRAARDEFLLQLDVSFATWGLSLWETALGLAVDISKPYDYRRTRILSKLRGSGTTTPAMIRNVATSFSNGTVSIAEYPGTCSFEVQFTGTLGMPPNIDDLTAAIEEIKPAHLAYTYVYYYRTNAALAGYTNAALAAYTHGTLREGAIS